MRRVLALPAPVAAALPHPGDSAIVTPAPALQAAAVGRAAVVVRLPGQLAVRSGSTSIALDTRETDAQGAPVRVALGCGVTGTPPSRRRVALQKADWKVESATVDGKQRYVRTTYGRTPAVQVVLDPGLPSDRPMPPVSDAVQAAIPRQSVQCTVAGDATPSASR